MALPPPYMRPAAETEMLNLNSGSPEAWIYESVSEGLGTHTGPTGTGRKGDTPVVWEAVHMGLQTPLPPVLLCSLPLHLRLAFISPAAVECPLFILKDSKMGKNSAPSIKKQLKGHVATRYHV